MAHYLLMRFTFCAILFIGLWGCATKPKVETPPLIQVSEMRPNSKTAKTRQNLQQLLKVYDLTPFVFTNQVVIESMVVPHSHPVLTLNSRYADEPYKLLSALLHEQMHWWAERHKKNFGKAANDLTKLLPGPGGTKIQTPTQNHLLICYLEYRALAHLIGVQEAREVISDFVVNDKLYTWIYTQVLSHSAVIENVVKKYALAPVPLN